MFRANQPTERPLSHAKRAGPRPGHPRRRLHNAKSHADPCARRAVTSFSPSSPTSKTAESSPNREAQKSVGSNSETALRLKGARVVEVDG